MAPLKCTIPDIFRAAALLVPNGALVQPFITVSEVKLVACGANDAPSSDVKHWASLNNFSAWILTTPVV